MYHLKLHCILCVGTRHATQFPCPRGYYNPEPMTQSLDSCLPCPPGHYCEKERLTKVSGKCKAGQCNFLQKTPSQPYSLLTKWQDSILCASLVYVLQAIPKQLGKIAVSVLKVRIKHDKSHLNTSHIVIILLPLSLQLYYSISATFR